MQLVLTPSSKKPVKQRHFVRSVILLVAESQVVHAVELVQVWQKYMQL